MLKIGFKIEKKCMKEHPFFKWCFSVCVWVCVLCVCVCKRVPEDNKSHLLPCFPERPSLSCANRLAEEEKGPALMCCMWRIYWRAEPLNQWCRKCIIRTVSSPLNTNHQPFPPLHSSTPHSSTLSPEGPYWKHTHTNTHIHTHTFVRMNWAYMGLLSSLTMRYNTFLENT